MKGILSENYGKSDIEPKKKSKRSLKLNKEDGEVEAQEDKPISTDCAQSGLYRFSVVPHTCFMSLFII